MALASLAFDHLSVLFPMLATMFGEGSPRFLNHLTQKVQESTLIFGHSQLAPSWRTKVRPGCAMCFGILEFGPWITHRFSSPKETRGYVLEIESLDRPPAAQFRHMAVGQNRFGIPFWGSYTPHSSRF